MKINKKQLIKEIEKLRKDVENDIILFKGNNNPQVLELYYKELGKLELIDDILKLSNKNI